MSGSNKNWENNRKAVLERDGHKCLKCGSPFCLSIDHIKPRKWGGGNGRGNLQTLCVFCNFEKSANNQADYRGNDPVFDPSILEERNYLGMYVRQLLMHYQFKRDMLYEGVNIKKDRLKRILKINKLPVELDHSEAVELGRFFGESHCRFLIFSETAFKGKGDEN